MSETFLKHIATLDNLRLAFNYAKDGAKKFFVSDFIRHQDYTHSSKRLLNDLRNKLLQKQYRPKAPLEVEVPKSGLATRPGTVIDFEDFIVLYAIINAIVDETDKHLPDNVYSWRVIPKEKRKTDRLFEDRDIPLLPIEQRKEIKQFEAWYDAWPAFDQRAKDYILNKGYHFLATTDITAYFENINHDVLKSTLISCSGSHDHYPVNLLIDILRQWTVLPPQGNRIDRGIPQGNDVSSYLGNIYLIPLDRELTKLEQSLDIKYLRYMDDVKILAKTKNDAKKALFVLNKALRSLHLNTQTSKTDIYTYPELFSFIHDERFDLVSPLIEEIQQKAQANKLNKKECEEYEVKLKEFLKQLPRSLKSKDIRLFKRLLTGLTLIKSRIAIYRCFNALVDTPSLTDKIARYFEVFQGGKRIPENVLSFISKTDEVFEYQIARLVEIYRYKDYLPPSLEETLYKYAIDLNLHWSIRSNCLIALSYLQISKEKMKHLWTLFNEELNYHVKRAMLLCFINTGPKKRNEAIRQAMFDTDARITFFAKFLDDILYDEQTQQYEIENLFRIGADMFVDESYKLLLLRESGSPKILGKLVSNLKGLKLTYYPNHIRFRIEQTKKFTEKRLQTIKTS